MSLWIVFATALGKLEMNFGLLVKHPRTLANLLPGKQGLPNNHQLAKKELGGQESRSRLRESRPRS